jgi:hypothetical protein
LLGIAVVGEVTVAVSRTLSAGFSKDALGRGPVLVIGGVVAPELGRA